MYAIIWKFYLVWCINKRSTVASETKQWDQTKVLYNYLRPFNFSVKNRTFTSAKYNRDISSFNSQVYHCETEWRSVGFCRDSPLCFLYPGPRGDWSGGRSRGPNRASVVRSLLRLQNSVLSVTKSIVFQKIYLTGIQVSYCFANLCLNTKNLGHPPSLSRLGTCITSARAEYLLPQKPLLYSFDIKSCLMWRLMLEFVLKNVQPHYFISFGIRLIPLHYHSLNWIYL